MWRPTQGRTCVLSTHPFLLPVQGTWVHRVAPCHRPEQWVKQRPSGLLYNDGSMQLEIRKAQLQVGPMDKQVCLLTVHCFLQTSHMGDIAFFNKVPKSRGEQPTAGQAPTTTHIYQNTQLTKEWIGEVKERGVKRRKHALGAALCEVRSGPAMVAQAVIKD